ncbi:sugar O-acetyltransferase [Iodobacter fluviatilis]|uniref:Maltose O-acetyltransferase n=1 Tax=Iodobacter fluviatilis TaxID=537 RepID=A0A377SUC9_9NEIS|nr:sugar O-acetyltransferase [Iodobacter fluviatilis]TCU86202.1 maltose O-acetyltransferase [Iodobacter fluviatilis]STR44613.1 Maltose O-acetyltransferase [Iodobacter fluviatilis]
MPETIYYHFSDLENIDPAPFIKEQVLLKQFNNSTPDERRELIPALFAKAKDVNIYPPLYLSRGWEVELGPKVMINLGVSLLGGAPITIGEHSLIGPHVQIITVNHPVDPTERQRYAFTAKPVHIGANVWIGAGAIICPGVSIGDHSVVGAGAVVTHDVPRCTLVAGNPAREIRKLEEPDLSTLYLDSP